MSIRRMFILLVIVYAISYTVLSSKTTIKVVGSMFFHRSYINTLKLHTYKEDSVKTILQQFNSMADGGIVKYEGSRPINIIEMPVVMQFMYPSAVGVALIGYTKCDIYIVPNLDYMTFRETLLHEYLHCFAYEHTEEPKDLMYYAVVPIDKEENIKYYARDLKRKYYVHRFYRF